ncbi:MAG: isochorismatase family protein [Ardenticatenaceae bacterium]|nr:isochorismatase family protein [Ardenticatenaceae bacterium]
MHTTKASINNAALLVIDIQDSFKESNKERWAKRGPDAAGFEESVTKLLTAFRTANLPIYFCLHSDGDPGFERDSPHYKLMDFLNHQPGEPIIHKTTRNPLTSTNLQHDLIKQGIRRLVIIGIQTEQCCETTARVAADLGFDVDFVTEATLTFPIPHPEKQAFLSVQAIVERTEYALRNRFARISNVDQILSDL